MVDKIFDAMAVLLGLLLISAILALIVMLLLFLIYMTISFGQTIWELICG